MRMHGSLETILDTNYHHYHNQQNPVLGIENTIFSIESLVTIVTSNTPTLVPHTGGMLCKETTRIISQLRTSFTCPDIDREKSLTFWYRIAIVILLFCKSRKIIQEKFRKCKRRPVTSMNTKQYHLYFMVKMCSL